jgi:DNA-directed RNA polymerase specialized sigma24 family protein
MSDPLTPDGRLVQRMAAGDRGARRELSHRHRLSVYAQVYAVLIDPAAAGQVVVDTFDHAWRSAKEFNPGAGSPLAWLSEIARELAARRRPVPTPPSRRPSPIP